MTDPRAGDGVLRLAQAWADSLVAFAMRAAKDELQGFERAHVDAAEAAFETALRQALARQSAGYAEGVEDEGYRAACRLLDALHPGLKHLPTATGVITQIDNVTVGLKHQRDELRLALLAVIPEGWADDDTMDYMPGIKQARRALAAVPPGPTLCHYCGKALDTPGCLKGAGGTFGHITVRDIPPGPQAEVDLLTRAYREIGLMAFAEQDHLVRAGLDMACKQIAALCAAVTPASDAAIMPRAELTEQEKFWRRALDDLSRDLKPYGLELLLMLDGSLSVGAVPPGPQAEVDDKHWIMTLQQHLTRVQQQRDELSEALKSINDRACFASEEDTSAQQDMLLKIGEIARAALRAADAGEK